jgi:hypothetical protein
MPTYLDCLSKPNLQIPDRILRAFSPNGRWKITHFFDPRAKHKVVVAIQRVQNGTAGTPVYIWRSSNNPTSCMVSDMGAWAKIPNTIRYRYAENLLGMFEKMVVRRPVGSRMEGKNI